MQLAAIDSHSDLRVPAGFSALILRHYGKPEHLRASSHSLDKDTVNYLLEGPTCTGGLVIKEMKTASLKQPASQGQPETCIDMLYQEQWTANKPDIDPTLSMKTAGLHPKDDCNPDSLAVNVLSYVKEVVQARLTNLSLNLNQQFLGLDNVRSTGTNNLFLLGMMKSIKSENQQMKLKLLLEIML